MKPGPEAGLARSRKELAKLLAQGEFAEQAISRAYFGALYAAEAALLFLGQTRSKHAGVIAAFGKLVIREGGFDERTGRLLRSLFDRRNAADYGSFPVPREEARSAISDAERFVESVADWIRSRLSGE